MKLRTKLLTGLCLLLGLFALVVPSVFVGLNVRAESSYGDAFDYSASPSPVRYKTMRSDTENPSQKGLLLYAYDNGAFATFKADFNSSFAADIKPAKNGKSVDLTKYSFVFTDTASGKSFAVVVANKGTYNDVYVSVDGNNAGVYYYTSQWDVNGTPYGYTALYNNGGNYTNVASDEIRFTFDPTTMQVSVLGNGGAYHLVWDFSKEYNDGKQLKHNLPKFDNYTVKVVFDEIKSNGKGELLVYSFGGYVFDKASADSKPSVYANVVANAMVGQPYSIPHAEAFDLFVGKLSSDDVSVNVYDVNGKAVNDNADTFTPSAKGEYYLYYTYKSATDDAPSAVALYRIEAVESASVAYAFAYDSNSLDGNKTIGAQTAVYIPVGTISSNLIVAGTADVFVTIKKDGNAIEEYSNVPGGFDYKFVEAGTYTLEYKTSAFGVEMSDVKTVTVSADITTYIVEDIPETVDYLSTLHIVAGKVYKGNEAYDMEVSFKYPSGKTVNGDECLLDELGTYEVTHTYKEQTYCQTFVVKQKHSDMFGGEGVSAKYGTLVGNNTIRGQLITLTNNNAIVYNKVVDLSDNAFDDSLDDKSQNTPFLEMFAQPHSVGITDVQGIYITLTDKYDSNNYVIIRVKYLSYLPHNMRIRTMASGQSWVGYDYNFMTGAISVDSAQSHEDGGTIVSFDCTQAASGHAFDEGKLRLYFDNNSGRLYTRTWQDTTHDGTEAPIPWLIRDYKTTDQTLSAGDTPWKGFTTGEVYLSIYATGISDTANFLVTNIDGEDLTDEHYTDHVAPSISVDVDENAVPYAKVGKEFKVFDYSVSDGYSLVASKNVSVLHGGQEVALKDGMFTPQEVGVYTIRYTATDAFGNTTVKTIEVEAKNTISKLAINIDGEVPDSIAFGQVINLPLASCSGGAGGTKITVKVLAVDADEEVDIVNGAFTCLKSGLYRIEYVAEDYIGNTATKSSYFDVTFSTAPVFNEEDLVLPEAFIKGEPYYFDEYIANYYNGNGAIESVKATISVEDADGVHAITDGKYIPVASDDKAIAKVIFSFTANGQTLAVERNIPVLVTARGIGYLKNFFSVSDATVDAVNDAVTFAPTGEEAMKVAFARAIMQQYLTINFKRYDVDPFTVMTVYLRDIHDANAVVKLTYRNRAGSFTMSINDGAATKANFSTTGNFAIRYDISTNRILDVLGMEVGKITTYLNGSAFDGFPSGYAYMSFEADGKIGLTAIANQNFNNYVRDSISPLLTINGSFSGTYIPGQTVTLPSAIAYDVIGNVGEITVVVKSADGKVVVSGNAASELSFVPQQYGTYSVVYSVTDSSGNTLTYPSSIIVVDDVKPTLTFDGSVPTTAKSGTTFKIPGYTVSDNGDITKVVVKKYICGPDGIMIAVGSDNTIKFGRKGEYILYYFVVDESNNTTNYAFKITVS